MGMIVSRKPFVPAPDGEQPGVCVDVVDQGNVPGYEGRQEHKIRVVWEIEAKMEDGRPFIISKSLTVSLGKKANLRKFLVSWRGREFTQEELDGFDLEKLVGVPCRLIIQHRASNKTGEIYADVTGVLKAKDVKLKSSGKYVREKDRDGYVQPQNSPWNQTEIPTDAHPGAEQEEPAF